jgi:hypothetical protein
MRCVPGFAALLLSAACAPPTDATLPEFAFPGPGRLAVVWHVGDPDDLPQRSLVVYDGDTARSVPVEQPLEVRWLGAGGLLVLAEQPARAIGEFPDAQLLRVREGSAPETLGAPNRYYNAEPRADGSRLLVGLELNDQGDSALEVWLLSDAGSHPIARRELNLDEPRWAPDGDAVAVARMVESDSDEDGASLGVGGITVPWPRLFTLDPDLEGPLAGVHDAARGVPPAAGGSLPLWWGADGLYARQRAGIVRCASPESGCELVFATPPGWRVVDARPFDGERALALLVDTGSRDLAPLPTAIWLIDLAAGRAAPLAAVPRGAFPIDLDWTPSAAR